MAIDELVSDATQRRRWIRLASILTAVSIEGLYAVREHERRDKQEARTKRSRDRD
jgi:hypothetical protein